MINKFNLGDIVSVVDTNFSGEIISIEGIPEVILNFLDLDDDESLDIVYYRIKIDNHRFVTVSENGIEKLKPERSTDEQY